MPINPRAQVHEKAQVAASAQIGAWVEIGENVVIGENCQVAANVSIQGKTDIGEGCEIHPFVALGGKPEHLSDKGDDTRLTIGADSVIREHVTIHRGTKNGGGRTFIGKRCYIMIKSHIAHDCYIGSGAILGGYCALSGHTHIGERSVLLGKCGTLPFVKIGQDCYLIAGTELMFDVPPMMVATRHCLRGINARGLLMRGAEQKNVSILKKFYERLTQVKGAFDTRTKKLKQEFADCEVVQEICQFVEAPHRYPWLNPYPDVNKSRYTDEHIEA